MNRDLLVLLAKAAAYTLFWGWNLLLLSVVGLGFGPVILVELLVATWKGMVPWGFAVFAFAVIGIPTLGSLLAVLTRLRSDPGRLLSMFYGIQVPVMLLLLVRLFAIHELVAANTFALAVAGLGALGLLRTLLHGPSEGSGVLQAARLGSAAGYAVLGLWWAAATAILALPMAGHTLWLLAIAPMNILETLAEDPGSVRFMAASVPFFLFGFATVAMFMVMPFAALGVTARNLQLVHRASRERWGLGATAFAALCMLAVVTTFGVLARQPQAEVFARIQAARTDADRRALMEDRETLREGLLAGRLGGDRYLEGDGSFVVELWDDFVGEAGATVPRAVWNVLIAPITYQAVTDDHLWTRGGHVSGDVRLATDLYAEVFDAPMLEGEREALVRSATYTWSWRDAAAGLLDVGQQRARLERQDVAVERHGDVAKLTVHDVWRNQTFERQEIRLSFDLPESAAVTGLWLGQTDDRADAFAYIVAPRGAAQEVYESEVQRRVDPALLEQVGPRQYRLRAFPVEPRESSRDDVWNVGDEGPPLHVWVEATVPAVDGRFPLPRLTEARNAYWDERTVRTLDGQPVQAASWLPEAVDGAGPAQRHEVVVAGQRVVAEPATPGSTGRRTVDVVVDGSASMAAHAAEVTEALQHLGERLDVTVLCVKEQRLQICDTSWSDPVWWGHRSPAEHLAEWSALHREPDALVVLTDPGSYALMSQIADDQRARDRRSPSPTVEQSLPDVELPELWLVHFGGYPAAYPDWTLDRIQRSGGGVVGSPDELLARMADPSVVDGWRFTVVQEPAAEPAGEGEVVATPVRTAPSPFDAIAARAAIREIAGHGAGRLGELDTLHRIAVEQHVVTAWSSMIVLVNDWQKKRLEEASQRDDRFEREAVDGESFAEVSAVPEPTTWLLLALGGGLALGARRRVDTP